MGNVIEPQVDCTTAQDFLEALSPLGPYFKDIPYSQKWLFRGQGKDDPLIPSLYRKGNGDKLASFTRRDIQTYDQRVLAERDVLIQFFEMADRRGLVLPDDSQELRNKLETMNSDRGDNLVPSGYEGWAPSDHALSLVALAQHYGVPTRLLDWTRLPLVAAYFAAEGPYMHPNSNPSTAGPIIVWAFYFPLLGKQDVIVSNIDPIRIVTAPSASNQNLKAQQGVFSLVPTNYSETETGNCRPLDQMLEEMSVDLDPDRSHRDRILYGCRLRKFTLPASEALHALYLLAKLDITPSTVYPGYRSIVDDLKMRSAFAAAGLY